MTSHRSYRDDLTDSGADRSLHQLDNLLLDRGAPSLKGVRHRPQIPVVEGGRVLEAKGRVPIVELARVLKEDDDLVGRVRVSRHSVPSLWRQVWGGRSHRHMYPLGQRTILWRHRRDAVEDRLQPIGFLGTLLALSAQLLGALFHRGALGCAEAFGLGMRTLRGHFHVTFRRCRPGAMPAIGSKARPDDTTKLLDS